MEQRIVISENLQKDIAIAISECEHDKIFVLVDETTEKTCWTLIKRFLSLRNAELIVIGTTDTHKNLETVTQVWKAMSDGGGTRHSCLINLGGGMVTDLGGFVASTFKRGMDLINIPTTLLAMVDASVGGKTGINFNGLKNEIGAFNDANYVILCTKFLKTLDVENIRSGYSEMLKHGLISNDALWSKIVNFPLAELPNKHLDVLQRMVVESIHVKEHYVIVDPREKGLRRALNFGHTFGHAFESWSLKRNPILHGYAVAYGMICELYLSTIKTQFPVDKMRQTVAFIKENYGTLNITCDDYDELIDLMLHDKKNMSGIINFTLLSGIGDVRINQTATEEEIKEALDFLREG